MKILLIVAGIFLSILGYGYWYSTTHATLHIRLELDQAVDSELISRPDINIELLDADGLVLAQGVNDKQYNYVHLIHPVHGSCHEIEKQAPFSQDARNAWQMCFSRQSTWIAKWINDVHDVNIRFGNCLQQNTPIELNYSSDWWLWWVPHPHIGGKPYANYSSTIKVKGQDCK